MDFLIKGSFYFRRCWKIKRDLWEGGSAQCQWSSVTANPTDCAKKMGRLPFQQSTRRHPEYHHPKYQISQSEKKDKVKGPWGLPQSAQLFHGSTSELLNPYYCLQRFSSGFTSLWKSLLQHWPLPRFCSSLSKSSNVRLQSSISCAGGCSFIGLS